MMNNTTDIRAIKLTTRGEKYALVLMVEADGTYTVRSYTSARTVAAACNIKTFEEGLEKLKECRAIDGADGIHHVRHFELSATKGWIDRTQDSQLTVAR